MTQGNELVSKNRRNKKNIRKQLMPYGYLLPTIILLFILLLIPIVMVIGYFLYDNPELFMDQYSTK